MTRHLLMMVAGCMLWHTVGRLPVRWWAYEGAAGWWALPMIGYYCHSGWRYPQREAA